MKPFIYALAGLKIALRTQRHFRWHLAIAFLVFTAGWYFEISRSEWLILTLSVTLVLAMELVNTSIEYIVNLVSPDFHPLAGQIKDVAAASVLVASLGAAVAGLLIFVPRIFG